MDQPHRPTILVADDSRVVTEMVRRWLRELDAEVLTASDGSTALQIGLERGFDLAILDHVLPGRTGAEVLQGFRVAGVQAPIIMISGVEDRRTRAEAMELGADLYLSKPVTGSELVGEVRRLLATPRPEPAS